MTYVPADAPLTLRDLSGITRPVRPDGEANGWLPRRPIGFASGRAALLGALHALGVGFGSEVLLPSYSCESIVSPVRALRAQPAFYQVDRAARPILDDVERRIGPRTRAVVLVHYLGFPGPVEEIREICSRRGVALVEDCAHALFSALNGRLLGTWGDAAFWSPWKSLPLPDGGLLVLNRPDLVCRVPRSRPSVASTLIRLAYRSAGAVEATLGWSPRMALLRQRGVRRALHDRTSGGPVVYRAGSWVAWRLLFNASAAEVARRRREHYRQLLDVVRQLSWARPLAEDLPPGVCPLGLAMVAEERDRWRDALLAAGVNVRAYWEELPAEVELDRFPDAAWLSDRILVLPVHQGLGADDLDWLTSTLRALDRGRDASRRSA